jgi:REP element-mobilizing transposase RayT
MHVVFSTKERRKIIPTQMKERLWAYTAGICQHQKIFVHAMGGMEDHIHMLLQFPATLMVADAIREIKANSSRWMSREIGRFAWLRAAQLDGNIERITKRGFIFGVQRASRASMLIRNV